MKKFECVVERTDKFTVEFDETVCNEKWMDDFRQVFYDFYSLDQHADHIAQHRARFGRRFIEGYGIPLEDGKVPYWANEKEVNKAINIKTISEDNEINVDVNEI